MTSAGEGHPTGPDEVTTERHGDHVAVVMLHRPPNNYFDTALVDDVATAYEELGASSWCRAVVLASEGRHFCAGLDFGRNDAAEGVEELVMVDGGRGRDLDGHPTKVAAVANAPTDPPSPPGGVGQPAAPDPAGSATANPSDPAPGRTASIGSRRSSM